MAESALPDALPASGIGSARPSFVTNARTGGTATPQIPTLSPAQFGAMPNWSSSPAPEVQSALLQRPGTGQPT